MSFRPSADLQSALARRGGNERGWYAHRVEGGTGPVNLDFYPVAISKLPTVSGATLSPAELLRNIRLQFADLLLPSLVESFGPVDAVVDGTRWESDDPTGAVMQFSIRIAAGTALDRAAVVVAESAETFWRFATVYTGATYGHPVSGTREFGIFPSTDGHTFYIRAADRATTALVDSFLGDQFLSRLEAKLQALGLADLEALGPPLFKGAELLWTHVQAKVADYVNSHGGTAIVSSPISQRVPWDSVTALYTPTVEWLTDYAVIPITRPSSEILSCEMLTEDMRVLGTLREGGIEKGFVADEGGDGFYDPADFVLLGGEGATAKPLDVTPGGDVIGYVVDTQANESPALWVGTLHAPSIFSIAGSVGGRLQRSAADGTLLGHFQYESTTDPAFAIRTRAFRWRRRVNELTIDDDSDMDLAPTTNIASLSEAVDIQRNGVAVLNLTFTNSETRVYRWGTVLERVRDLPGSDSSYGFAMNNDNVVVGYGRVNGTPRGFMAVTGQVSDLGTLGGKRSFANSINARGIVVGAATRADGSQEAVIREGGKWLVLDERVPQDLGWRLESAVRITDRGRILAVGRRNSVRTWCVLFPVG